MSFSASLTVIGFLGVEYLTCLVEEARKPLRYWRYVLQSSASICFILAITTTLVISLILPCQSLPIHAALPAIYGRVNVSASRYVLSIATVSGLSASLVAVNLAPARVLHAMSKDKLICPMFGWVTAGSGAPWVAYMCGVVPTLLAILLRTETLTSILRLTVPARFISMVTAGCLMRYRVDDHPDLSHESQPNHNNYQTFRDVRKVRSYSFTSADGSVISQEVPPSFIPEESDMKSVTSSFILQSIATATLKLNSDSEQNSGM